MSSEIKTADIPATAKRKEPAEPGRFRSSSRGLISAAVILIGAGLAIFYWYNAARHRSPTAVAAPPAVTVNTPLIRRAGDQTNFLGQFSAVDVVEIRAQVGGTLSEIHFTDGQIVHKGDLLFVIDTRPFEIQLHEAEASYKSAQAHLDLTDIELWRAQQLKSTEFGSVETVDQRRADQLSASAALDTAAQAVQDAQLNLEYCHVVAPFTGKISAHRVSVGALVSGSRAGSSPTTLLTTLVSLDPIYLDFDMSESEFLEYQRAHHGETTNDRIAFYLSDEDHSTRKGTLDFVDNALNRSSGTIRARATVDNPDLFLVPGEFAHIRLTTGALADVLLIPEASVSLDQSQHSVMTVAADGTVVPKEVTLGGRLGALRIVRNGLTATDRVITDGLARATPGDKVTAETGGTVAIPTDADN